MLKTAGQPERARELLALYVAQRTDGRDFWDLDEHRHFRNFTDADMIQAFADQHASFEPERANPTDILVGIAGSNRWNSRDLTALAELSADDYYSIFKECRGDQLHAAVSASLQFSRIVNATPEMQAITNNAKTALTRIGAESPVNAQRVQKYGIQVAQGLQPAREGEQ